MLPASEVRRNAPPRLPWRAFQASALLFAAALGGATARAEVAPAKAFPGAEGCGETATGGRGGRVIKISSLADDGPGSLRAAIESEGARIIAFDVAGVIDLEAPLVIRHGDITIAGQSSPGGVTLRGYGLTIDADNVVVRYLRSRPGPQSGAELDAVSVAGGSRIILDHVSASWSVDETLSVSQTRSQDHPFLDNVTVQWSIISEALDKSVHSKGAHGYGSLVRGHSGACFSFHHNLWAHHRARMPRPGNFVGAKDDPTGPSIQFWNNVFYNWGGEFSGYNADTAAISRYDFMNNWYVRGPDSEAAYAFREECAACQSHFSGNAMDGETPADQRSLLLCKAESCDFRGAPVAGSPPPAHPVLQAYRAVLAGAGAAVDRDQIDARIVEEAKSGKGGVIDDPSDRGGRVSPLLRSPLTDTDSDGMPDAWENARGLNASNPADANGDDDGNGYTNVEDYLNEAAVQSVF